jgi:hypothetical protein
MKTLADIVNCLRSVDSLVFSIALKKERKAAEIRINPRFQAPHRKKDRLVLKEVRQEAAALMTASTSIAAIADAIEDAITRPAESRAAMANGGHAEAPAQATLAF